MNLLGLMQCKKNANEKVTDFIEHYQLLYSRIKIKLPSVDLQIILIENLQKISKISLG
jgi:hypothetical protein